MIVSRNEIEAVCYRAALGAGLSYGLAEDAAAIAGRLAALRPDGLAIMLRALTFADAHRIAPPVFIRDSGGFSPAHPVLPSLMAGPVAADLRQAYPGVRIDTAIADEPVIMALCVNPEATSAPAAAFTVDEALWRAIAALAARTYVPASETSRLMGAGAGLNDSD